MHLLNAYQEMITTHGWNATAGHLGMTKTALENRVYERSNQAVSVDLALLLQKFSGKPSFARAVAHASGGTFVQLPAPHEVGNECLLKKFNQLHKQIGLLSSRFNESIEDGEVDSRERSDLVAIGDQIHACIQDLLAVTFAVFCVQPANSDDAPK